MSGFVLEGWMLVAVLISVAAIAALIAGASGYYAASSDLREERSRAWAIGVERGRFWESEHRDAQPGEVVPLPVDPYTGGTLTPAPPVHVIPTPPRGELFDQDEPPAAPVAPRVITDDGEVLSPGSGVAGAGTLIIPRALLEQTDRTVINLGKDGA